MSFQNLPGGFGIPIMPGVHAAAVPSSGTGTVTLDAADEACVMLGHVVTADGASHTIDTTGSSSLQWRTGTVIFASASTTVRIGLAAVDTAAGPPGRAANTTNVINFDVYRDDVGAGGGITTTAWQTDVPTNGTKTIANGDLVAFAVQMRARGGTDTVVVSIPAPGVGQHLPGITSYVGAAYATVTGQPNAVIVFNDGTLGWFYASEVWSAVSSRGYNVNTGTTDEYGQLYQFPFPVRISGIIAHVDPDADFELLLYTDPLGTPVARKTLAMDANVMASATGRRLIIPFGSPYDMPANTPFVVSMRPTTTTSCTLYYKTFGDAAHRVTDPYGTSGYGVGRLNNTGAFSQLNSGLDHYYIGIMAQGFEHGVWPTGHLGV